LTKARAAFAARLIILPRKRARYARQERCFQEFLLLPGISRAFRLVDRLPQRRSARDAVWVNDEGEPFHPADGRWEGVDSFHP